MLALVRSFLAARAQDDRINSEELRAFTERTGIDIRLRSPKDAETNRTGEQRKDRS